MKTLAALSVLLAVAPLNQAADLEAGKAKVGAVCAACHGANGVSVSDTIPNLAAQRAGYIEGQLKAFREGTRKGGPTSPTATMTAIATQLTPDEIKNEAAYFASLPGAGVGAKSEFMPNIAKTSVTFPEGYQSSNERYHTINFPAARQVRYYYVNPAAAQAAKAGKALPDGSVVFTEVYSAKLDADQKPVVGPDGYFVSDKLVAYVAMARDKGWGDDIPEMLRNENWNYAVFSADKKQRPVNQAECLACHKPLDKASYMFTMKELAAVKEPASGGMKY
jgi:cytochrome c553